MAKWTALNFGSVFLKSCYELLPDTGEQTAEWTAGEVNSKNTVCINADGLVRTDKHKPLPADSE